MPTKTTSKKSKKKNASFGAKLKRLAGGKAKPFLAIVVVLAVVGVGYYGFVRSSANVLNADGPPKVTCGKKLTKKECNQKQAESDAQFYAQLQRQCNNANRVYSGNNCGGCKAGFQNEGGSCVERKEVNCAKQNRIQEGKYKCGGCQSGFRDKNGSCEPREKVNCAKQNRVQNNPYDCGGCESGWNDYNGTCIEKKSDDKKTQRQCINQFRVYLGEDKGCGRCIDGYYASGTACAKIRTADPATVKANCDRQHRQYNSKGNACASSCVNGYYLNQSGSCVQVSQTNPDDVKAACAQQYRVYNTRTNSCGGCVKDFYQQGNVCVQITEDAVNSVKAQCEAAQLVYMPKTNSCSDVCVDGYVRGTDGKCTFIKNWDRQKVQQLCKALNKKYDSKTNTCADVCLKGYTQDAKDACVTPMNIKKSCEDMGLKFDATRNQCKSVCRDGYVVREGKCIERSVALDTMDEKRCVRLGRVWLDYGNGKGSCSTLCLDEGVKITRADTNRDRDYCAAPETGGLGVTAGMSQKECQEANRIYLGSVDVCSARCALGYHLRDGKCEEIKRSTAEVVVVCDPTAEDCSPACEATGTAQDCSIVTAAPPKVCDPATERCNKKCEESKRTADCRIPTNPYVTVAVVAQAPEDTTVDVNSELTEEQCALLGREWIVSGEGEEATAGCSTATCASEADMIVENEGNPYCQNAETQTGYVAPISQEDCDALHREWIEEVNGCAQVPLAEGETDKFVNAEQCVAPYTTYYVHENGQGECFEPSVVDRIQAVAELFGAAFNIVRDAGPQAFCNLQPSYHWDDEAGECKGDRDVTGTVEEEEVPVSLQATPHSASVVSVNVAALNTSSYTLYYGPEEELVPVTCDTNGGAIGYGTCFVTGLKAAAAYEFSAKVAGSDKVVAKSNIVQTPTACVPFTVEPISNTQVRVSWESVPGADYYTVQHDNSWPSGQELGPNGSIVVDRRDASDDYRVNSHSAPGFDNTCAFKTVT